MEIVAQPVPFFYYQPVAPSTRAHENRDTNFRKRIDGSTLIAEPWRETGVWVKVFQMAWGLGLEPRFSDSKSDVLPIRRPPNKERKWLGDQESNLDSQIQNLMSYQLDDPQNQSAPAGRYPPGRLSRRQTTPAFNDVKARYIIRCWPIFISNKHNRLSRPRQAVRLIV